MSACACGQPLHYTDPRIQAMVQAFVDACGELVMVTTPAGSWWVPRHFIALHGLNAEDVPAIAARYGFVKVTTGPEN